VWVGRSNLVVQVGVPIPFQASPFAAVREDGGGGMLTAG